MLIYHFTYILIIQFFASNISFVGRPAAKVYEIPQLLFQHDWESTESACTVKMKILDTKTLISHQILFF